MTDPRRVPVVVGVADLRVRTGSDGSSSDDHPEPLTLVERAARAAVLDACGESRDEARDALIARIDGVYAVRTATWAYDDLPGLLSSRMGIAPTRTLTTPHGGHWPAELLETAAHEVATGTAGATLVVGGESGAALREAMGSGVDPADWGWTTEPGGPPVFDAEDLGSDAMLRAGLNRPTRVYPLFENRFSHDIGDSRGASVAWSAQMYAAFSECAVRNPAAWNPHEYTAQELATVSADNRMVTEPYSLRLNAMPYVNQAAAVVVTSLATARELGIDDERLVYVWGGAGATDPADVLARRDLGSSPALADAVARTLDATGLVASEIDVIDAYSCFPIVPKLLIHELDLPRESVPGVTGGHSFFGGPLNSYTLHSVVTVTHLLRDEPGTALVHGNGGYLTKQRCVVVASTPHADGYVGDPIPREMPSRAPDSASDFVGPVEIVTATAEYGRDGVPTVGLLVGRTADGRRVAGSTDAAGAELLSAGIDVVGRFVHVTASGGALTLETLDPDTPRPTV